MDGISNEKLVELAGSTVIGTTSGLQAQKAQAELNKRLIESIDRLKNSLDKNNIATTKYNKVLLTVTVVMLLLALLQILLFILTLNYPWYFKILLEAIPVVIVIIFLRLNK